MFHVKHGQTGQSPPRRGWLLQIGNAPDADSVRICRHLPVFRLDVSRETPHVGTGIDLHGMLRGRLKGNVQYRSPFRPRHLSADPEVHPWSKVAHVSMRWRRFTWNVAHRVPDAYPPRAAPGDPFLRRPSMPATPSRLHVPRGTSSSTVWRRRSGKAVDLLCIQPAAPNFRHGRAQNFLGHQAPPPCRASSRESQCPPLPDVPRETSKTTCLFPPRTRDRLPLQWNRQVSKSVDKCAASRRKASLTSVSRETISEKRDLSPLTYPLPGKTEFCDFI